MCPVQRQREHLLLGTSSSAPPPWLDDREELDRRAALHERIGTKLDEERRRCRLGFLSLMQSTHGDAYPHLAYLQSGTHGDAYLS